ncbi:arylsulfatase [Hypoxylon sp. EC38]|nr:arylsulfatase [Hypoxylon sp. EC38]
MTSKKPNFLIIVADDLGFSDTGPFGSEIKTPALDSIAKDGVQLTNFHTASACSPTRSMLFSGTDNHIAGLGQMAEHMGNRELFKGKPGYEGYLNFRVAALSEILQDAGYLTLMSGKWHLGAAKEHAPCSRGFDKGFVYLPGSGNHYNYEPQFKEGEPRPSLAVADPNTFWMRDGTYLNRWTELPKDFYSTKTFTDELLNYFETRTPQEKEQPFFSYLAFTAPHWPLHAPEEIRDLYKGMYDDGPESLKRKRLARLIELGLIPKDVEPAPMVGLLDPEWETMTPEARASSARKMETFAAMVHVVDQNIQRVLDYLCSTGELDNTFIVFMSDNGAEGTLLEALPMLNGATSMGALIEKHYNNTLENIGNKDSFTWYGASWACASMAPSRGFKTWITEGGIRCPCLVRYPPLTKSKDLEGSHTNAFTTVMDLVPTILDLAGASHPYPNQFRGREIVPVRGKSWVSHLSGQTKEVHDGETAITGWELFGLRAIRQGKWKAIYMTPPRGRDTWELYDMNADPGEIHDLAEKEPEVLARLVQHWNVYYSETGMFDPDVTFHVVKDKRIT